MRWMILCLVFLSEPVTADIHRFAWTGKLVFDPATPVGDTNLGEILHALSAPGALTGDVPVEGQIAYRSDAPFGAVNPAIGASPDAVSAMALKLGQIAFSADFSRIGPHAARSRVGTIARADGGFCGDADHCALAGLTPPGWGNQVTVLNDAGHVYLDETGQNPLFGDALGFMVGRTPAAADFVPAVRTERHGVVSIDGLYVLLFASPGRQFVHHVEIPAMEQLTAPGLIGRTEISLFLEVPGAREPVRVEGIVTGIALTN